MRRGRNERTSNKILHCKLQPVFQSKSQMAEKKDENPGNSGKGKDQIQHTKESFPKSTEQKVTVTLVEKKESKEHTESQQWVEGLMEYNMCFEGFDQLMEVKFNGHAVTREFLEANDPTRALLRQMDEEDKLSHPDTLEALDGGDGSETEMLEWKAHPGNYNMIAVTLKRYKHGFHVVWTKNLDYLRGIVSFCELGLTTTTHPPPSGGQTPLELFNRLVEKVEIGGVQIDNPFEFIRARM